ncbi:MAG: TerB family tellurite resistance protein [SAR324 cluster bacterium]|nr:TerB family tellurite resistance protein [SAR324 cluster bacterium]
MSLLNMLKKVKTEYLSFDNHPAWDLDLENKMHYLNGLALLMNVDDEIHDSEKEYLSILLNSFELPEETLNYLVAFAQKPDQKEILALIKSFSDRNIKYVFMFDCLMMAYRDERFHENEKTLLNDYFEMLKLTEKEKQQIIYIHEKIRTQDQHALFRLFRSRDFLQKNCYEYLLKYYDIKEVEDIEKDLLEEIRNELKFEQHEWIFCENSRSSDYLYTVSKEPVTNRQYLLWLQWLYDHGKLVFRNENQEVRYENEKLLLNLGKSSIVFHLGVFDCPDEKQHLPVTAISLAGATEFCVWYKQITEQEISIVYLNIWYSYQIHPKSGICSDYNEMAYVKGNGSIVFTPEQFRKCHYFKPTYIKNDETDSNMTFRVMFSSSTKYY